MTDVKTIITKNIALIKRDNTNCGCCYDVDYLGPYADKEAAERRIDYLVVHKQYKRSKLKVQEEVIEIISDGRIIWRCEVFDKCELHPEEVLVNDDGSCHSDVVNPKHRPGRDPEYFGKLSN